MVSVNKMSVDILTEEVAMIDTLEVVHTYPDHVDLDLLPALPGYKHNNQQKC